MKTFLKKHYQWILLVTAAILVKLISMNRAWVEQYYSNGLYPAFAGLLRRLFGWLPFSIGDILYGLLILWLLWKLVKALTALFKGKVTRQSFGKGLGKTLLALLLVYVIFNVFWGINYNRRGIAIQLGLKSDSFNLADLENINHLLVQKVNSSKQFLISSQAAYPNNSQLFKQVAEAYTEAEKLYPYLHYRPVSLKSSLWGWLGNYAGFTGYYNPFSGEAQVNTTVPRFVLPFTSCHEVAHQLGYAKENEANFVGYLAATASKEPFFHYSVYLDLFQYANRTLAFEGFLRGDSSIARSYRDQLLPEVKNDLKELRAFQSRHRNPFEPMIRKGYGLYLRSNEQPKGIRSYDEVTTFIMAYYKKFGRI